MKRLSTLTVLSLLLSATALTGAHAQDVAALCKVASSGGNTVVSMPVSPQLAQELQAGGIQAQAGTIAKVHGDGKVEYNGQDISQQTQSVCANGGAQPQGDKDSMGKDTGAQKTASTDQSAQSTTGMMANTHKHRKTAAGDHYSPASGNGSAPVTTSGTGPETMPSSDAGQVPTGSAPGSSSSPLGTSSSSTSSASGLSDPTSSATEGGTTGGGATGTGSGAVFTPPPSGNTAPSSALTEPAPGGSAASPSLTSPSTSSSLATPPGPMHAGIGSSPTTATSSDHSTLSGGSSMGGGSMSSGSMGGGSMGGGSMGGGSSSGGSSGGSSSGGGSH